ncbi:hypothetical protein Nepgr_010258 [Nepenthes gracilis]|uniref:Cyclin-like domain-containing protein n=1 Tax=Nepenthes gracilis TaxID=150966 RepID=A0AAD3SBX1_NEPGR|nr:hypothetical protein Nepgr_010258 [Nepenthes gracilis]
MKGLEAQLKIKANHLIEQARVASGPASLQAFVSLFIIRMSNGRTYPSQGATLYDNYESSFRRNHVNNYHDDSSNYYDHSSYNLSHNGVLNIMKSQGNHHEVPRNYGETMYNGKYDQPHSSQYSKRRKFSVSCWVNDGRYYYKPTSYGCAALNCNNSVPASTGPSTSHHSSTAGKRDRSELQDGNDAVFMSREEIDRCSPSRKDGIDALHEAHLRYSYCAFIQNLGMRLELPQTTIGSAMVLCHRFFVRRSHACHDRYLIGTATLFLASKSEDTPCPLNNVLRAACEILHKKDATFLSYVLPSNWFELYRERVIEAEQLILTTLDFELDVQHPYDPLTTILNKLGLSETIFVNLALNLVSEGLRSSLWLQFKPQHIAAGAAYLAAKLLNMDLDSCRSICLEFQSPPSVLQDVVQQLTELF